MQIENYDYFLEVDIVQEVADVWKDQLNKKGVTNENICEAVIHYALFDSYKDS